MARKVRKKVIYKGTFISKQSLVQKGRQQALKAYCPHIYTLSSGQNNFSFFNRKKIESPEELDPYLEALHQTRQDIADGTLIYDPEITYMNFIVGDGDNVAFMKGKFEPEPQLDCSTFTVVLRVVEFSCGG